MENGKKKCKKEKLLETDSIFLLLEEEFRETANAVRSQIDCFYETIQQTNAPEILLEETAKNIQILLQEVYGGKEGERILARFKLSLVLLFFLFKKENRDYIIAPPVPPTDRTPH